MKKARFPFVSIVVTTYNSANTIKKCVHSIQHQTYPEQYREIIIVDDGSNDDTQEIISGFENVKVVLKKHEGIPKTRTLGFRLATGDIVVSVDSDVFLEPSWLKKTIKHFEDETVGIIQGPILPAGKNNQYDIYHTVKLETQDWRYPTAAIAFRGSALNKAGRYFDPDLFSGQDTDLAWRIINAGYKAKWADDIKATHAIIPLKFWDPVLKSAKTRCFPLLIKKHPQLRKFLRHRILWAWIYARYISVFLFIGGWIMFGTGNLLSGTGMILTAFSIDFYRIMKTGYPKKLSFKVILLVMNLLLSETVGVISSIYGSLRHGSIVL